MEKSPPERGHPTFGIEQLTVEQLNSLFPRLRELITRVKESEDFIWENTDGLSTFIDQLISGLDPEVALLARQAANRFLETLRVVSEYRKSFFDDPVALFSQTFGQYPRQPEHLEIVYRPTGIYFLVAKADFRRLHRGRGWTNSRAFVRSDLARMKDLKKRVAVIKKETQPRINNPIDAQAAPDQVANYNRSVEHEEKHLIQMQYTNDLFMPSLDEWLAVLRASNAHELISPLLENLVSSLEQCAAWEQAAYHNSQEYSLTPTQVGAGNWLSHFVYIAKKLKKYARFHSNPEQTRRLIFEAFDKYQKRIWLVKELASYLLESVTIIDQVLPLDETRTSADVSRTMTVRSNLDPLFGEALFISLIPNHTERLLELLGFSNEADFWKHIDRTTAKISSLDIYKSSLFDVEEVNGDVKTTSDYEEIEIDLSRSRPECPATNVDSGPLGKYLEFVWQNGQPASILRQLDTVRTKGEMKVRLHYDKAIYIGEPLEVTQSTIKLSDGAMFLNLHLDEVKKADADNPASLVILIRLVKQCLGDVAASMEGENKYVSAVVAASNTKLIDVLTRFFHFQTIDFISDPDMAHSIWSRAEAHDPTLGDRVRHQPYPVAIISRDDFYRHFRKYQTEQPSIKTLLAHNLT